jgi:hypothetical protein
MVMNLFMGIGIIKEYNISFKRVISFFSIYILNELLFIFIYTFCLIETFIIKC